MNTIYLLLDFLLCNTLYRELNPRYYKKFKAVSSYITYKNFKKELETEEFKIVILSRSGNVQLKESAHWIYVQGPYIPKGRGTFIPINFIYGIRVCRKGASKYIDLYVVTYDGSEFYFGRCAGLEYDYIEENIKLLFPRIKHGVQFSNRIEQNSQILEGMKEQFSRFICEENFFDLIHNDDVKPIPGETMNKKYEISVPHFYCLEYSEENHKMKVDIDFRESQIVLNTKLINTWEYPFDKEPISQTKKTQIINNIYKYLLRNNSLERVKLEED
ncbi:MAG: hypothetical protein PHQ72_09540 [Hespellia sp.]|nr:hypothetical protein [Hespellia sp.]